jgi:hypothetical protein
MQAQTHDACFGSYPLTAFEQKQEQKQEQEQEQQQEQAHLEAEWLAADEDERELR